MACHPPRRHHVAAPRARGAGRAERGGGSIHFNARRRLEAQRAPLSLPSRLLPFLRRPGPRAAPATVPFARGTARVPRQRHAPQHPLGRCTGLELRAGAVARKHESGQPPDVARGVPHGAPLLASGDRGARERRAVERRSARAVLCGARAWAPWAGGVGPAAVQSALPARARHRDPTPARVLGRVCESTAPRVFYILSWAALRWLPDQPEQLAASNRDAQSSLAIGHTSTSEMIGGPFPPSSMTE